MAMLASVVIPAHNESRIITRNLTHLLQGGSEEELDVLVVCNGCSDDTAARARAAAPCVRVLEIERPSKAEAMRVGNSASDVFPRVHLDADVVLRGSDLRRLVAPLHEGAALAAAPQRVLVTGGCSAVVRWYFDVWEQLPQVRSGLFGRGVVALSEEGQRRLDALPPLMGDDLAASEAFTDAERVVVEDAVVQVVAPRTLADLVRRRVRVATGNEQADRAGVRRPQSATSWRDVADVVRRHPRLAPKVSVFLLVTVVSRVRARAAVRTGDFTTWQRDESSRG